MAQRRGLSVGDQFSIGDLAVHVAGIFSSSVPSEENLIYISLEFLQYTRGLDAAGLVTQHEVLLTDDAEPDRVAAEIDQALRTGPVATTTVMSVQDRIKKYAYCKPLASALREPCG